MLRKLYLMFIVFFASTLFFQSVEGSLTTNKRYGWEFNNTLWLADTWNNVNLTNSNGLQIRDFKGTAQKAVGLNGANAHLNNVRSFSISGNTLTVMAVVRFNTTPAATNILIQERTDSGYPNYNIRYTAGKFEFFWYNSGYGQTYSSWTIPTKSWFCFGVSKNGTQVKWYHNASLLGTNTTASSSSFSTQPNAKLRIGANEGSSSFMNGSIADIRVWNDTKTIQDFETYCDLFGMGSNNTVTPSLTLSTNLTSGLYNRSKFQNYFNLSFTYTGTASFTSSTVRCQVKGYNTSTTFFNTILYPITITNTNKYSFSVVNYQSNLTVKINCSTNNASASLTRSLFVDTVTPTISVSSSLINNSRLQNTIEIGDLFKFNVTAYDVNLFAYNRTIKNLNNGSTVSSIHITNILTEIYKDNISLSIDNSVNTSYRVSLSAWDSHTGLELKNKAVVLNNTLFFSGLSVFCLDIETLDYIQEKDKIKLVLDFKQKKDNICFIKGSNFEKVIKTSFPNHYVDLINNVWIDDYYGKIEKVDAKTLQLSLSDTKKYVSESLGELNYINKMYYFSVGNIYLIEKVYNEVLLIKQNVTALNEYIQEEFNMIAFSILYLGMIAIGYWFSQTNNYWLGLPFMLATIPFNLYFWKTYEGINYSYIGIAFGALTLFSIGYLFIRGKGTKV